MFIKRVRCKGNHLSHSTEQVNDRTFCDFADDVEAPLRMRCKYVPAFVDPRSMCYDLESMVTAGLKKAFERRKKYAFDATS
jgi:hypothetical protein